jgi:hypothetical protein
MARSSVGRVAVASLIVAGSLSLGSQARAQQHSAADVAQARVLFNEGTTLRDKGNLAGALEKLRTAHSISATPITGLELGRTYQALGKLVEAREAYLGVARIPVAPQETPRSTAARTNAAKLAEEMRGRIPKLTVKITGAPIDSVTVTIDGTSVPSDAVSSARLVNPGTHEVVATPAAGARATTRIELKENDQREIELTVTPAAPAATPTASSPAPGISSPSDASAATDVRTDPAPRFPVLIYGGFGLAAAGVVVGSVTGLIAKSKKSSLDEQCRNTLTCPRSAGVDDDLSTGRTMGNVATVSFVVAGAGAAVGVIALIVGHKDASGPSASTAWVTPWFTSQSAGLSGLARF